MTIEAWRKVWSEQTYISEGAFCREKYEENIVVAQWQERAKLCPDMLTHHNPKKQLIDHIFGMGMEPVPDSLGDLSKGLIASILALLD